jgi:hypothetical protein
MEGAGLIALVGGCSGAGPADGCTPTQAGDSNRGPSTNLAVLIETLDINDPDAATVAVPNANALATPRAFHQATSLENAANTLLVVTGGANLDGTVDDVEVFRADGGALARLAANLNGFPSGTGPVRHAAVAVSESELLVIGGQRSAVAGRPDGPGSADVFLFTTTNGVDGTPVLKLFGEAGRAGHQTARLADGSILVVGGTVAPNGPTAEIIRAAPGTGQRQSFPLAGPLAQARDHGALAILPNNQVLFTGGHTVATPPVTSNTAEIYFGP